MNLKEFREYVLNDKNPDKILSLADKYLRQLTEMGNMFVLPAQHKIVKPALDYYAGDLKGWVKFVKSVRDRLPVTGRKFHPGVHELYRTLDVRLTQVERRERLEAAVGKALAKRLIENTYDAKMRYSRRCTHAWKLRRDQLLKVSAAQTSSGRLSVEEREGLLAEFWANVDAEIENGELPKP